MAVQYCQVCTLLDDEDNLVHEMIERGEEIGEPPGIVFSHVWHHPACDASDLMTVGSPRFVIRPT